MQSSVAGALPSANPVTRANQSVQSRFWTRPNRRPRATYLQLGADNSGCCPPHPVPLVSRVFWSATRLREGPSLLNLTFREVTTTRHGSSLINHVYRVEECSRNGLAKLIRPRRDMSREDVSSTEEQSAHEMQWSTSRSRPCWHFCRSHSLRRDNSPPRLLDLSGPKSGAPAGRGFHGRTPLGILAGPISACHPQSRRGP